MPTPRASKRPAIIRCGAPIKRCPRGVTTTRSSATQAANSPWARACASKSDAKFDLPAPDAPRMRMPLSRTTTQLACKLWEVARREVLPPRWRRSGALGSFSEVFLRGEAPCASPEGAGAGGCPAAFMRDGRREAHGEARARARALFCRRVGGITVLGPDLAAMRFDDLPRDREAEAGVLAEALVGPVRIEALENSFERVLGNAGAFVLDDDLDKIA